MKHTTFKAMQSYHRSNPPEQNMNGLVSLVCSRRNLEGAGGTEGDGRENQRTCYYKEQSGLQAPVD